jgi:hypothetical protein
LLGIISTHRVVLRERGTNGCTRLYPMPTLSRDQNRSFSAAC